MAITPDLRFENPKTGAETNNGAEGPEATRELLSRHESERMETVGRLVGGVAHDFANLLTLIAGYSELLLGRVGPEDALRPELDEIRKAAQRGARLTTQLLDFTRGQAIRPRALNLNAVVTDLERMLRLIIGESAELEIALSPTLQPVFADAGQMEQVIMNLVLNARDAIPADGLISIATADGEVDESMAREYAMEIGPCVMLTVSDNGHGISLDARAHIFEPFFTTKEAGKGTGLGLSTVHRIARESHGGVWVESSPGQGARFVVCLPRAAIGTIAGETTGVRQVAGAGSETLLVVEDEEGVRRLLVNVLQRRGYQVLEASTGAEALRIFQECGTAIHLVLTDMVMPRMSGRQLGEALRQIRPGLKIIYMSGYTDDVLVRTGALGPDMTFLQKPLRPELLASKVREALDAERSATAAEAPGGSSTHNPHR